MSIQGELIYCKGNQRVVLEALPLPRMIFTLGRSDFVVSDRNLMATLATEVRMTLRLFCKAHGPVRGQDLMSDWFLGFHASLMNLPIRGMFEPEIANRLLGGRESL